jgi:hypothetical protein
MSFKELVRQVPGESLFIPKTEEFFYFPHMRELFPLIRMASECRMREAQGK